jgi:hypothetical protein
VAALCGTARYASAVEWVREAVLGLSDFGDVVPGGSVALAGDDFAVQFAAASVEVLVGEVFPEPVRLGGFGRVGAWFDGVDMVMACRARSPTAPTVIVPPMAMLAADTTLRGTPTPVASRAMPAPSPAELI